MHCDITQRAASASRSTLGRIRNIFENPLPFSYLYMLLNIAQFVFGHILLTLVDSLPCCYSWTLTSSFEPRYRRGPWGNELNTQYRAPGHGGKNARSDMKPIMNANVGGLEPLGDSNWTCQTDACKHPNQTTWDSKSFNN
ncbi:hypothetical protein ASPVEDRAFT_580111 [Aspergillus versicolor CBS 583.65]|uniref:Uncharacterized protein n=1 Tax=Aspergillus versicolor CBS 583.65 TaxID=1036611 RepID=A0A1L9PGL2_ASPVE|nr:uncharacterized protein ASPVEDRAFT_580111 [Aspergillus versicolor CBS 583.65]OJJ00585.1 hypothetical protein ASPVEDRAFT_580111 [Aspergillus versicolor CBS 583.65]